MTDADIRDLQSEATRRMAIEALENLKAERVEVLDLRGRASFTDAMIFASGNSSRHVNAIADAVIEAARERGLPVLGVEGAEVGEWILVDLGDVIVHVMQPDVRAYYDIEKLWRDELAE